MILTTNKMHCTERDDTRGALALHRHAMTQSLEEDRAVVHLARRPVGQHAPRKIHVSSFSRPQMSMKQDTILCVGVGTNTPAKNQIATPTRQYSGSGVLTKFLFITKLIWNVFRGLGARAQRSGSHRGFVIFVICSSHYISPDISHLPSRAKSAMRGYTIPWSLF
jgi:hypothetical protein